MPTEFGPLIRRAVDLVGSSAVISVHCHNDLGLAVANTLTAIMAGARQVEVTINGLGERAGNAALEEVVMALQTRSAALGGHTTGVVSEQIAPTSRLVSYLTGFVIQPNKAIVGRNAFAHESGIHQDGVLKNPLNFEIMTPQSVGLSGNRLTVGKLSGRRGLQGKLKDLGFDVDPAALDAVYRAAIALADVKKEVTDADLVALVGQQAAGTHPGGPGARHARGLERHQQPRWQLAGTRVAGAPRHEPHGRGQRQRPRGRAVRCGRRCRRAGARLASPARGLRDPGGLRRRGCPGPGDGPGASLVGHARAAARR